MRRKVQKKNEHSDVLIFQKYYTQTLHESLFTDAPTRKCPTVTKDFFLENHLNWRKRRAEKIGQRGTNTYLTVNFS